MHIHLVIGGGVGVCLHAVAHRHSVLLARGAKQLHRQNPRCGVSTNEQKRGLHHTEPQSSAATRRSATKRDIRGQRAPRKQGRPPGAGGTPAGAGRMSRPRRQSEAPGAAGATLAAAWLAQPSCLFCLTPPYPNPNQGPVGRQAAPYTAGARTLAFDDPCDYFRSGKAKASTLSLSVLVAIEMFNALNALSEARPARPARVSSGEGAGAAGAPRARGAARQPMQKPCQGVLFVIH
jgi:hypothetical protein